MDPFQFMVLLLLFGWLMHKVSSFEGRMCPDCSSPSDHFPQCPRVKDKDNHGPK
jgi:hypothetical protein